ncbi:ABC transporter permease [Actinomadura atramentaria]|uniref:ABC transporter permease n=1 Tax=Actinomadura atramentaria TaxID=1990 RepID=UPI00037EDF93|nr:ABC transporter permease [Actinomadura atramentaria]
MTDERTGGALAGAARDTWLIFLRYLRQTLRSRPAMVFGAVQPLLYLVLFGPLLTRVGEAGGADSWRVFVPGIVVQLALFGAGFAGFGLIADLRSGVVDRFRVAPVSRVAPLLGRVLRDTLVVAVQAVLLTAAGVALGMRAPLIGIAAGLVPVLAAAAAIAALSHALALTLRSEDAFAPLLTSVTLPLMLLSGVLLPMGLAPRWLDVLSRADPLRYVVEGTRAAFAGDVLSGRTAAGAAVSAVLLCASVAAGARRFRREGA